MLPVGWHHRTNQGDHPVYMYTYVYMHICRTYTLISSIELTAVRYMIPQSLTQEPIPCIYVYALIHRIQSIKILYWSALSELFCCLVTQILQKSSYCTYMWIFKTYHIYINRYIDRETNINIIWYWRYNNVLIWFKEHQALNSSDQRKLSFAGSLLITILYSSFQYSTSLCLLCQTTQSSSPYLKLVPLNNEPNFCLKLLDLCHEVAPRH